MEHHSREKVSIGGLNFRMEESNFQHVKDRDATVYERFNLGVSHSPLFLSFRQRPKSCGRACDANKFS